MSAQASTPCHPRFYLHPLAPRPPHPLQVLSNQFPPDALGTRVDRPLWTNQCGMPPHVRHADSQLPQYTGPGPADTRSVSLSDAQVEELAQQLAAVLRLGLIKEIPPLPFSPDQQRPQWNPENNKCSQRVVELRSTSEPALLQDTPSRPDTPLQIACPIPIRPVNPDLVELGNLRPSDDLQHIFSLPGWTNPHTVSDLEPMVESTSSTPAASPCPSTPVESGHDDPAAPADTFSAYDGMTDAEKAECASLDELLQECLFDGEDVRKPWKAHSGDMYDSDSDNDSSSTAVSDDGNATPESTPVAPLKVQESRPPLAVARILDYRRTPRYTPTTLSRFHPVRNLSLHSRWRYHPSICVYTEDEANPSWRYQCKIREREVRPREYVVFPRMCDAFFKKGRFCPCLRCKMDTLGKSLLVRNLCRARRQHEARLLSASITPTWPSEEDMDAIVRIYGDEDDEDKYSYD
ncbi:hypothetical protein EVG20_g3238 [Dentipellis fragilis]|uniref:Uncharacterized protein n=1 Tax=Dentipellis fragilis TaxID=205917 RepID=A0A4Y9Z5B9_9AGAM|nr:hypothetical protein EVG20_g3238 [Dentipellis fragilis]